MAEYSVTQLLSLINQQIERREALNEYLSKAWALMQVTLEEGFLDFPESVVQYYLWALSDIIDHTRNMNEEALSSLLKNKP